ncbi:hypothetical protein PC119_g6227 [Phytophthora cactorum]|uniref:Uncharacterized protein n=1 Tax=Phytophthora cactorum TaxID=29920 RepID=A0A8T1E677_9STRA|nr:hypothetical protein PC117_g5629 [Phytophthora cactorum]KAG3030560.1 hypothetical protein PC119_g6227 [Phytophthora cactorum]KAG3181151.1 hypothetical protein C6341_g6545 [Phytophthora cactorum]
MFLTAAALCAKAGNVQLQVGRSESISSCAAAAGMSGPPCGAVTGLHTSGYT